MLVCCCAEAKSIKEFPEELHSVSYIQLRVCVNRQTAPGSNSKTRHGVAHFPGSGCSEYVCSQKCKLGQQLPGIQATGGAGETKSQRRISLLFCAIPWQKSLAPLKYIFTCQLYKRQTSGEKNQPNIMFDFQKKKTFNMLRRATHANPLYPMTKLLSRLPNTQVAIYTGDTKKMQAGDTA